MAFWVMFFISLAFTVAGELLRPKQKFDDAKPSALGDFSFPTADASRVIPVFWGTCKLQGPNCVWFGDYSMEPINKKVKTGWFSSDVVTQGFHNFLGVQLTWAWGPIDEFIDFLADDTHVIHTVTESADYYVITMNDPTHMSADEPTNGLSGVMYLYKGTPAQPADSYLNTVWGEDETSAFRRVSYSVMRHCYIGNSETPPPFALVARRTPNQLGLTGGKHNINGDSNVACACYEIMTDKLWGLKMDPARIDIASFIACGNTLATEGLGISMMIDNPLIAKDLIADMLRHVDGVIYPDPVTGLYTMKLARNDYDVDTLQVFDDSNISDENFEFSRLSWDDTRNTIIVNYVDRSRNFQTIPVQYQDLANISARRGQIDPETIDFLGFSNYAAAYQAAARACKTRSSPLVRVQMTVNREGYDLRPGSVFKLFKPNFRIEGLVMRVIEINYGTLDDPRIQVVATEDIFTVNGNAYAPPPDSGWIPPKGEFVTPLVRRAIDEAPYQMIGAEVRSVMALGSRDDSSATVGFDVWSDPAGGTAYKLTATSSGVIASGELAGHYDAGTPADDATGFSIVNVEDTALLHSITLAEREQGVNILKIDNEYMAYKDVSVVGSTVTVANVLRGVFDTVPADHEASSPVYFFNPSIPLVDPSPYSSDVTIKAKLLAFETKRHIDIATDVSVPLTLTLQSRALRPNPPGKVRINGVSPGAADGTTLPRAFSISWEHRNKLSPLAVSQDATGIASEPNVSYTIEVRNASTNALIASKTNLAGPSANLDLAAGNVKVLLYAVNAAGLKSLYPQQATITITDTGGPNTITGAAAGPAAKDKFDAVRVAATTNIVLSGLQTIDGVALAAGDRVLAMGQTTGSQNGHWIVVAGGAWTRAPDADESAEYFAGKQTFVAEGGGLAGTVWAVANTATVVLGTTTITFVRIGAVSATTSENYASVRTMSLDNITLSGLQTIEGVTLLAGERVLVAGQTTGSQNGIYAAAAGAWARTFDADQSSDFFPGKQVYVSEGTFAGTVWANSNTGTVTVGTTTAVFSFVGGKNENIGIIGATFDSNSAIAAGKTADVYVPYGFKILEWRVLVPGSGNTTSFNVYVCTPATFPPDAGDSIVGTVPPRTIGDPHTSGNNFTGWTTVFSGPRTVRFEVEITDNLTQAAAVSLIVRKQ